MRYAVLSDVHSNLEALSAVLETIGRMRIDSLLCLGDLVGYGPNPDECVELLRSRAQPVVRGNHDHAAVTPGHERYFNAWGQAAIRWTRGIASRENLAYLAGLPLTARAGGALLVHASPSVPEAWRYVIDADDAAEEFAAFGERVCLIGHSHVPLVAEWSAGESLDVTAPEVPLAEGRRYIVNVGSVGQPRDGDPRAAFGVLDLDESRVELCRVAYDASRTREKIRGAGLPLFLGDRLLRGQ